VPPETDSLGKTVFLVDSDHRLGELRARRLRLYGITVYIAASIEEARVHLEMNSYDLILLATRENRDAGISFRQEIRRHNQ
jgi:DNA-binding response OmpR family regulator